MARGRKKIWAWLLMIAMVMALVPNVAVYKTEAAMAKDIEISSLMLTPNNYKMHVGETYTLLLTICPSNATEKIVTWKSTNPSVVKVSSDGTMTALSAGKAQIQVRSTHACGVSDITVIDNKVTSIEFGNVYKVISKDEEFKDVNDIPLFDDTINMKEGQYAQLSYEVLPDDATNKQLTKNNNTNGTIVTSAAFSKKIFVSGIKAGTAVITLTTNDGSNISKALKVKVEHAWDNGTVTKKPTGTDPGVKTYKCEVCGTVKTETIKATGHKTVTDTEAKPTGKVIKDAWKKDGGKWYYYDSNGNVTTGWKKIKNKWYYFSSAGVMQTGWQKIKNKWYYLNKNGSMVTGWKKLSGKWYYLNKSGSMQTGWKKLSGKWYYFNKSGAMQTGWKKLSGKWYYFKKNGSMVTGKYIIGGIEYRFDSSGALLDSLSQYKKILDDYYDYYMASQKDGFSVEEDRNYQGYFRDKWGVSWDEPLVGRASYAIYDANSDGQEELFLFDGNGMKAIFTMKDGKPTVLLSAWSRGYIWIDKAGYIYLRTSDGAEFPIFDKYDVINSKLILQTSVFGWTDQITHTHEYRQSPQGYGSTDGRVLSSEEFESITEGWQAQEYTGFKKQSMGKYK